MANVKISGLTAATTLSTSDEVEIVQGGASKRKTFPVNVDVNGAITNSLQPAFLVRPTSDQVNIAVNTDVTVVLDTEIFDQGGDFASNTFTAPIAGKYQLECNIRVGDVDTAANYLFVEIRTSNRSYRHMVDPGGFSVDLVYYTFIVSVLADMDASDTATIIFNQSAGATQADAITQSHFSGHLVA